MNLRDNCPCSFEIVLHFKKYILINDFIKSCVKNQYIFGKYPKYRDKKSEFIIKLRFFRMLFL